LPTGPCTSREGVDAFREQGIGLVNLGTDRYTSAVNRDDTPLSRAQRSDEIGNFSNPGPISSGGIYGGISGV
jgi:hypothetical protein